MVAFLFVLIKTSFQLCYGMGRREWRIIVSLRETILKAKEDDVGGDQGRIREDRGHPTRKEKCVLFSQGRQEEGGEEKPTWQSLSNCRNTLLSTHC